MTGELDRLEFKRDLPDIAHAFPAETPLEVIELYDVVKTNMVLDAQDAGLLTIDHMLIERTARLYASMRQREMSEGYSSATDQKNINSLFLQLAKIYIDLVRNSETENRDKVRELALDMKTIVTEAVEDKELRRKVLVGMADLIEKRGLSA